ncbi:MAG TPA: hypothetical protein VFR94_26935 [Nitrososphaeraceae archaeon]|nr:hypothetical protein [Nitrososphaeraceae archaeon]
MRANLSSNMPIIILSIIIIFCGTFSSYYSAESLSAIAQMHPNSTQQSPAQQLTEPMGVKISSPLSGQKVPVGALNISGTSTDNAAKDCSVFVDVNDIKPLQKTDAVGPGGQNDYSNWSFTYTENYHLITEGPNELTAKLACNDILKNTNGSSSIPISNTSNGKSKWYSINVTGIALPSADEGDQNMTQSETQFANASKQHASVSDSPQHTTSDQAGIATLSDSVHEEKIADLDEEELSQPATESSSPKELQSEQAEIVDLDSPIIPETSESQNEESDDMIQYPSSDLITDDSLTYAEEQQTNELDNQDNLQQHMPMSNLPSENDGGDQFIEEIQGTDIDGADYRLAPDEDELPAELTEPPLQEKDVGPPLELFGEENQGQADLVQEHTGQSDNVDTDLSDEARSANDIYEMITDSFEQQIDTEEIDTEEIDTEEIDTEEIDTEEIDTEGIKTEQDIQDLDPGDVIAEEIPLMQTYTRDIESTLE